VVVCDVALQGDDHLVGGAAAAQNATGKGRVTLGNAIVNERVERRRHFDIYFVK
jgi:hypothetical protein